MRQNLILALYGRRNAGKDTAANLFRLAILFRASGAEQHVMEQYAHERLRAFLAEEEHSALRQMLKWKIAENTRLAGWIKTVSFSSKIHEMTSLLTGVSLEVCLDRRFKDVMIPVGFNKTIRQIMIDIGEGLRASCGPDVWVAPVTNAIAQNPGKIFIIPGMRHPNEYAAIKALGAYFIKVKSDFEEIAGPEEAEGLLEDHEFNIALNNIKDDLTKMWEPIVDMVFSLDANLFKV